MKTPLALQLAAVLLTVAPHSPTLAERTPPPRPPVAVPAAEARVVVKFRDGASTLRAHALAAHATPEQAAPVLADRATVLGNRHGLLLHAGAAVSEDTQVLRADPAHALDAAALAARLAADPEVEYAEPVRRARRLAAPNDPLFNAGPQVNVAAQTGGPAVGQWYLRAPAGEVRSAIDAVTAWDANTGNPDVVVAVLDTGVRRNHPDLAGKLLSGYDMVSDTRISNDGNGRDSDPSDPGDWLTQTEINADPAFWSGCTASDSSWHGTQVSGIVAAATGNAIGMAGTGRHVRVLPVRVLGKCFGDTTDINAAIRWAAGISIPGVPANPTPARVINLSLGTGGPCSADDAAAVSAAIARGAVVVAAAGNTAGREAGAPANCPGVIGVAGLRHIGTKVGFSDLGASITIAAPGGNCVNIGASDPCLYPILTTVDSGRQGPASPIYSDAFNASVGTSFSSPLVAGTAALLFSARSTLTPAQVRDALTSTARPFPSSGAAPDVVTCQPPGNFDQLECYCTTSTCGAGMLDANAAMRSVLGAGAAVQPAVTASPAALEAQQTVTLSSTASVIPAGRSVAARRWLIVDSGGIVGGFSGATDQETASFVPTGAGRVTVQLALTDDRGATTSADFALDIGAGTSPSPPPPATTGGGGGGGGTMSWAWLLGLAAAAAALRRQPSSVAIDNPAS